ncbi:DUF4864 domain-containing protein [Marinobacter sp. C2H3]|uniref:DUF4864 domain-containing protein n=1 Tax=Marinobacter sp. C2H3 TaxID=3119003 RepID=UPI00300EB689
MLLTRVFPFALLMLGLSLVYGYQPRADESGATEGIHEAILSQIEAFANDDRATAWSYAADGVKQRFGSPDVFVRMVALAYPAVHHATAIEFRQRVPHGSYDVQVVRLRGPDGKMWDAYYQMVNGEQGWKIAGVGLKPADPGI